MIHDLSVDVTQVGSVPEHSVVFSRLAEEEKHWLRSLLPRPGAGRGRTSVPGQLTNRQAEMVLLLDSAGLINHPESPLAKLRVRIVGLDSVGIRVARLLAKAGTKRVELRDTGTVDTRTEHLFETRFKGVRKVSALRDSLRESVPSLHLGRICCPDIAVVCSNRVWDRGALGYLLAQNIAHLPVVSDDRSIAVGPLIIPGRTPCSLCVEMTLQDQLHCWPQVTQSLERSGQTVPVDHLASVAAGLAVAVIESTMHGKSVSIGPDEKPTRNCLDRSDQSGFAKQESLQLRIMGTGIRTAAYDFHPECACQGKLELEIA